MGMEEQVELTMDDLFATGQIRLQEVSVFNWGSFSGPHTAKINPQGTLITGDTGAGKSTLIDGLMALLQPAGRASFNIAAAQGDSADRSLMSYIRGSFGEDHDGANTKIKNKREGGVVSSLRALYKADDGSEITLSALFWTTQSSQSLSDVKRLYIVANRNLKLKEIGDHFKDGNQRALKQWLKSDPSVICATESFSEYQAVYQKSLYMENKNAPKLLGRALGLKKIDNLTAIIRDLVLEPSTVRDDAKSVVAEFNDTVAVHQQMVDSKEQKDQLLPLVDIQTSLIDSNEKINTYDEQRKFLPRFINRQCMTLYTARIDEINTKISVLNAKLEQISQQEVDAKEIAEGRHAEYVRAGGGSIEIIEKDIGQASISLVRTSTKAANYQKDVVNLQLPDTLEKVQFDDNQAKGEAGILALAQESEQHLNAFVELSSALTELQNKERRLIDEITDIKRRPRSNIDVNYQRLRDEMVGDLHLDPEECMFIGELLDVDGDHKEWQGAIERTLGMLRITLAIPAHTYSHVTKWLNERHTGLYVRVQVVNKAYKSADFKQDGFLRKLTWRVHPYREWAKQYLANYDLHCVESTHELDKTLYSMTKQGLVHLGEGSFEKKDSYKINDRRQWCLGFSNTSRLALLEHDLSETRETIETSKVTQAAARTAVDKDNAKENLWRKLAEYEWNDINAPYWQERVETLRTEVAKLKEVGGDLAKAKVSWDEANNALSAIQQDKGERQIESGKLSTNLSEATEYLNEAARHAQGEIPEIVEAQLALRVTSLTRDDLNKVAQLLIDYTQAIEKDLRGHQKAKSNAESKAVGIMSFFRGHEKWSALAADWNADVAAIPDYLNHLKDLVEKGLPELELQWKDRMNKHGTQALAKINQRLVSEREDIVERIDTINNVLERTEFRAGTSLRLSARIDNFPHVTDFNQKIVKALSLSTSDDHEVRYQQLTEVMDILHKASDGATHGTLESLRLLDPRYQMTFRAEEIDIETEEVRDVWSSSGGKSGGEKESFAGAIVAASLAYVLTPDGYSKPVYSTVFLDEAFSNTSEMVSRRILKIFKDLNIHVNLITPYKNLNLARESAHSLLIVERKEGVHESNLSEVTWETIDRTLAENKAKSIALEADELGIEINHD